MSAFSAPSANPNLTVQHLKDEAIALEGEELLEEAYTKYEEVLTLQQSTIGISHPEGGHIHHVTKHRRDREDDVRRAKVGKRFQN
jgi:hypothetical protein